MALEFARLGWKVAGCARTAEAIATLAEELGNPHIFQAVDVTDDAAMQSFAKTVIDDLGAPSLLVINAALMNANAPLKDISPEEFANILAVNLGGVHNSIRAFLPAMEDAERGVIVNFQFILGSLHRIRGSPLLHNQMGDRGSDSIPVPRIAELSRRSRIQSRRHRHRHAPFLFRGDRSMLSLPKKMGHDSRLSASGVFQK
jgi:NAD(P)-dependent dehydrogenase (short-subunit alcohol dehydrogenase family)